ncbi:hypothetical protein C010_02782 [Brucella ovis 80/125]|nr:hypothetical protein C010_02782 [Brucella ovis 80/125]
MQTSPKAGAMFTSLQANYSSDISANNAASVVGVYGATRLVATYLEPN